MKTWGGWYWTGPLHDDQDWNTMGDLFDAMHKAAEKKCNFRWAKNTEDDVKRRIVHSVDTVKLSNTTDEIFQRFSEGGFIEHFITDSLMTSFRRRKKRETSS